MSQLTDQQLIAYIQSGDSKQQDIALRQLYRLHYLSVVKLVLDNNGTKEDATEIFQSGMIIFFNKAKQPAFELTSTSKTYLYAICKNIWYESLRKRKRNAPLEATYENIASNENISADLELNERSQLLLHLVEQLGSECQQILVRFYYYRQKIRQIQEELGQTSEQVVKNKKGAE